MIKHRQNWFQFSLWVAVEIFFWLEATATWQENIFWLEAAAINAAATIIDIALSVDCLNFWLKDSRLKVEWKNVL